MIRRTGMNLEDRDITMPRPLRLLFGWSLLALLIGAPWSYARYRQQCFRNFRIVREGTLYRSGQMNLAGLQRTIQEHNIRTSGPVRAGHTQQPEGERDSSGDAESTL